MPLPRARRRDLGRRAARRRPRCPRGPRRSATRSSRPARARSTATAHGDDALLAVHDAALVDFLRDAPGTTGKRQVFRRIPARIGSCRTSSPAAELAGARPRSVPAAVWARPGLFAYDTMTLDRPGHLGAPRGPPSTSRSPPSTSSRRASRVAYACCRPPGHHVVRSALRRLVLPEQRGRRRGGAPERLGAARSRSSTSTRTTATARRSSSTSARTCSSRRCTSTPARAGSRTSLGFADETARSGDGANLNLPLAPGTGDAELARRGRAKRPPGSPPAPRARRRRSASTPPPPTPRARSQVTAAGFREAGRLLGGARPADGGRAGGRLRPRRRSARSSSRRSTGSEAGSDDRRPTRFGRPLPEGGTIGVAAAASPYDARSELERGVEWWESRGYRVKLGDRVYARDDYVAGDAARPGRPT